MARTKPKLTPNPRVMERARALGMKEQEDLEAASGVSQGTISRIASGESAGRRETLEKLAAALHTSVSYLVGETDDPGPLPYVGAGAAPPAVVTVREPESPYAPDEHASPLERALSEAFDKARHLIRDAEAVKSALRATYQKQHVEGDLVDAARLWLDCAAQLRREGVAVTAEELLVRVSIGRRPTARDIETAARVDSEQLDRQKADAATKGIEWGGKRDALERLAGKGKGGRNDAE